MGRPVGQKGINIPPKMHLLFLILNVIKKIKKKASNKISIKLKVLKSVNGYQIKISTSKKFKAKATRTLNINKINFTIKNIKNKKIYYVKVRGYRKENGVNLYGKWSKIKKVK